LSRKNSKERDGKTSSNEEAKNGMSRRDFLRYGVGAAAIAVGATGMLGKIPLPTEEAQEATALQNKSEEPIVATVNGDQLTVMNGQASVKVKDRQLAGLIAEKLEGGN